MNLSRTIKCADFWDAMMLRSLLEEQGIEVRQPEELVFLSMVVTGDLDRIKAAVAQLGNQVTRSGPVIIEGEPGDDRTPEPSGAPKPEPIRPAEGFRGLKPISEPEPVSEPEPPPASAPLQAREPVQALEPPQEVEPAQAAEPSPAPEPHAAPEPEPPASLELTHTPEQPQPIPPPEPASEAPPREPAPVPELTEGLGPLQEEVERAQAAEPPESPEPTHTAEQPEPLPASEPASEGQMWAVLHDDGTSLTIASERMARSLAEAERQRGRRVTVRRSDDVETYPGGMEKPARPPGRAGGEGLVRPRGSDKPSVPGPSRAVGGADSVPESAAVLRLNENRTRRHRRLLLYALAAASIVVAAALVDHGGVLPRVGADTSSSPAQVGGPPQRPQLLPPLGQPPVMHFRTAGDARSAPAEPSAQPTSPAAEPSGAQNPAAPPTGSPESAESPQSATGESSGSGPSAIARGG